MSHTYAAISWNAQKRRYDAVIVAGVVLFLAVFVAVGGVANPNATVETLLIRALGACSFSMLHLALSIGPLCRLDSRWLPLLYNRRHLGVSTFGVALAHGLFSLVQFHAFGDVNPLVSLLASNTRFDSISQFPFQQLGLVALIILFLMAATSHDFWLANLTAPVWKRLHMLAYAAYVLVLAHVVFGELQSEKGYVLSAATITGAAVLLSLHALAALKEARVDSASLPEAHGYVDACGVEDLVEGRARVVSISGERVAIFSYGDKVSVVSNVCQHQNGPLGEGRIIDGCITCPWHGFQYLPETGASPAPFNERVPTFRCRIANDRVLVDPTPQPAGTYVEPALLTRRAEVLA